MKNSFIYNLSNIIHNSEDINELETSLSEILNEKTKFDKITKQYLELLTLESSARYKLVQIANYNIKKIRDYLIKALSCSKIVQKYYEQMNCKQDCVEYLNAIHQEGIILYELYRFGNEPIKDLNKAIKLLEYVQKNTNEHSGLNHYAIFHQSNCYLELARLHVNPKENCLKSMKLAEKSHENFYEYSKEYRELIINQISAISLLIKEENTELNVEFYETILKLLEEYEINKLTQIYIEFMLVDLGYYNHSILDKNLKQLNNLKNNYSIQQREYHEIIMLENELLIKKAEYLEEDGKKILYLLNSISNLEDYRENDISDYYYFAKSLFNEASVRIILSKLNVDKKNNLKKAKTLLLESKEFFNTIPLQNKTHNYPLILLNIAKSIKECALIENTIKKEYKYVEELLLKSLAFFEQENNKINIIETYIELGDLFFCIPNYKNAYKYLKNAIELIELNRNLFSTANVKKTLFEKTNKAFELIILTCYYLGEYEECLKFLELSKHRIFLDKIIENQKHVVKKPNNCELLYELNNIEYAIHNRLIKLKNFHKHGFKFYKDYESLLKLSKQQEYILNKIKIDFPEYYDYYYNHIFNYKKLDLKEQTLIEYYYTDDILLIFIVENKKLLVKKVDLKNKVLKDNIIKFKEKIEESYQTDIDNSQILNEIETIMENFFEILINPIINNLKFTNLIIIPYNELHNIPFYCLKKDDKYIIDKFTITIVQSGSSIKYLKNNPISNNEECLVIGNPDNTLISAENEALYIAKKLKTKALINKEATKENILKKIEDKHIIHYAGHGYFNLKNPLMSYLKLNDENLYVKDMEGLKLNSELIILSTCESGIVDASKTDEADSFISYLQIEGAKYIIASLWGVDTVTTKDIFECFYNFNDEYPKRLRLSQLKVKENRNLLKWGAFQIYGL